MLEEKLFEISPWKRDSHHGYVPVTLISFSDPMTPAAFAFDSMVAVTAQYTSKMTYLNPFNTYLCFADHFVFEGR